jgi:hypothetical protein
MNPSTENLKFAVKYHFSGKFLSFYSDKFNINKYIFFSYDTEALNKQLIQSDSSEREEFFVNTFGDTDHKKLHWVFNNCILLVIFKFFYSMYGYFIYVLFMYFYYRALWFYFSRRNVGYFKKYLPNILMTKLAKYVTAKTNNVRSHIDWNFFQHKLEKINLDACANQLVNLFKKRSLSEDQVKTFHISTNLTSAH